MNVDKKLMCLIIKGGGGVNLAGSTLYTPYIFEPFRVF